MPPASGSNNSTTNAAVQAAAKAEREEKLRGALKSFILKEKQRKKEGMWTSWTLWWIKPLIALLFIDT